MRLNLQSDYALRLLMQLAMNPDVLCTISEIACSYGISKNHLMKVANTLSRAGMVASSRGRKGGLALRRDASTIRIGDVVRATEGDFALVECFREQKNSDAQGCLIVPACKLKGVLGEAAQAFMAVLDNYTLEDLVKRNPRLRGLLTLEISK
ncbi:MAG: Rrf2 family transcriptional regulator [Kofleriaceae bacterium]|nr:Rrf2 family transcriptional regulator [Kofleriaceae bacterium]